MMAIMVTASLTMMLLNHPLSMGLILIIQTLITAMIIGYMMSSFLFSYIIIIIMLSGALVLFIYMASIASNEKFNSPVKLMMLSLMILIITFTYFYYSMMFMNTNFNMNEMMSIIKIFNTLTAQITMMMILYLLFTMIVVSNTAKVTEGPLRMKMNYE
uniref:NADH dehydrogenase subunit 6 n=1 Tax=Nezara viridula TaxID=85310 RepID=B7S646_NEZVI|nr:NADH dehydrogenase subunit 6 [Nezara viridula]ABM63315.1 NADH dehydrogenase subunit 6 [Nezara viridula]